MTGVRLDQHGITAFLNSNGVKGRMFEIGDLIEEEARADIFGGVDRAYLSGDLYNSGQVTQEGNTTFVAFVEPYAAVVHEGLGIGKNASPRPFLTRAAYKRRGRL